MRIIVAETSPLRQPPSELSRKQVLILDGIRYAVEMADIAYERLDAGLMCGPPAGNGATTRDIAASMMDAWSIIDAAHRFFDLVQIMPGLANGPWKRLLADRLQDALELRNCVQHQQGELGGLIRESGQVWGFLSWAEHREGRHTGQWAMMSPGAVYAGDKWVYIGPATLPLPVPAPGRIRLNAFGRQVYLARIVHSMVEATRAIEAELEAGRVRVQPPPAVGRNGGDIIYSGSVQVLVAVPPKRDDAIEQGE